MLAAAAEFFVIGELEPFPLPDGVDGEDGAALLAEGDHHRLIGVAEPALLSVAAEEEDAGDPSFPLFGHEETPRDGEFRTAVEDHLFDGEPVAVQRSGDAGIQGAASGGEVVTAHDPGPDLGDELLCVRGILQTVDLGLALRTVGTELPDVVLLDQITEIGHFHVPQTDVVTVHDIRTV